MTDLEELIHGLEHDRIVSKHETYYDRVPHELAVNILAFLKEQRPIEPEEYTVVVSQYGYAEHKCYRCGSCKCGLIRNTNWRQKYCPECGRKVKWDDEPGSD